ncbi:Hydroxymethylglutaryl-CoA synthase, mitochondrial [Thelohanellus kitauei]|uniref:Hydroxymethylglutaryl-CoA synthase, mitochondrial n=1 Tax=Thelohanellus kitauei TaxID=669202 RepID=A0A0C2MSB2_THEKT|nr:Hydroxymethylglutaryl-CoA synthase, mitochondrial [Thelohanellus kitauei]
MMDKFDVGIIDLEIYVPMFYVEQSDLEHHDCCDGKYVNGLGQTRMAVPSLVEDPVSMALTVVHRLMERVNLDYRLIGRLDVGTESSIDLSKSIKSQIMQLFQGSGNYSVEGADNINACYGGTAALFNVINWVRHTSNGSLGLVVTTDIAIYSNDESSARATGGAAAVCMLIGHNPILSIEVPCGSYMNNCYDFYKPLAIPYPMFDAKQSQIIYIKSLIKCSSEYMKSANFSLFDPKNLFALHCPLCKAR